MTLRFLDAVESDSGGRWLPGDVLYAVGLTPEVKRWLKAGRVEVVRDAPEFAVCVAQERAVARCQ